MSEQLLDLLKLCLLALLYLFFLRVLWAVWTELRMPAVASAPQPTRRSPQRARRVPAAGAQGAEKATASRLGTLRVIAPPEQAGRSYAVVSEMTLGRAPGCSIVVEDTYASQIHARVSSHADGLKVEDLGSTNGTTLNGAAVSSPQLLRRGDRIAIGSTVLELELG